MSATRCCSGGEWQHLLWVCMTISVCVWVCVCILNSSETHPGAAVHKGPRDLQHVRVLFELQEVPLQLLLVPGHLAELHLQPLKLLLERPNKTKPTYQMSRLTHVFKHQRGLTLPEGEIQACSHHDLQHLSGGRSQGAFILLRNSYVGLLDLPEEVTCQHRSSKVTAAYSERPNTLPPHQHCRNATRARGSARGCRESTSQALPYPEFFPSPHIV